MEFWEQPQPAKKPSKLAPPQPEVETQESPSFIKKNKRLIIVFLVFILVLSITIFTILFFGQKSSQTQNTQNKVKQDQAKNWKNEKGEILCAGPKICPPIN